MRLSRREGRSVAGAGVCFVTLAVLIAGCADATSPTASTTGAGGLASTGSSTVTASVDGSAGASGTSSASGSAAPSTSASPSGSPSGTASSASPSVAASTPLPAGAVVVTGRSLAGAKIGDPADAVEKRLVAALGKPTHVETGTRCGLPGQPPTITYSWDSVSAVIGVGTNDAATVPTVFDGWSVGVTQLPASSLLRLAGGQPLTQTWTQLHAAYPTLKRLDGQGVEGDLTYVFFPDGLRGTLGPDLKAEFWQAGTPASCD